MKNIKVENDVIIHFTGTTTALTWTRDEILKKIAVQESRLVHWKKYLKILDEAQDKEYKESRYGN